MTHERPGSISAPTIGADPSTRQNLTGSDDPLEAPALKAPDIPRPEPEGLQLKPLPSELMTGPFGTVIEFPAAGTPTISSVDQAAQYAIWPTLDEMGDEVARGFRITRDQITEALVMGSKLELERRKQALEDETGVKRPLLDLRPEKKTIEDLLRESASVEALLRERIEEETGAPAESIGGAITRNVTRVGLYLPLIFLLRGAGMGPITSSLVGGTLAAQAAFEADEPALANLLAEQDSPILSNAVTKALARDPDDPRWEKEVKQAIEETILGVATFGAFTVGGVVIKGGGRAAISRANKIYNSVTDLRRKRAAAAVGINPDNVGFQTSFRRGVEEADLEVAREADKILRRFGAVPAKPEEIDVVLGGFRAKIESVARAHSSEIPGGRVRPYTTKDVDAKVELLRDRLRVGEVPPGTTMERVSDLRAKFDENDARVAEATKRTLGDTASSVRRSIRENVIDRSGTVKVELLAEGGEEGKRAVRAFELSQGAGVAAQRVYSAAYRRIFQDVPRRERAQLADLIRLRRIREIKSYDPDWEPPVVGNKDTTTVADYDGLIDDIRKSVGEENYIRLSAGADRYFYEMAKALDVMRRTGVISADEYARLWRFQWSPIRFLKEMDPVVAEVKDGKRVVMSVRSSGIKPLSEGHRDLMINNPELFLAEVLSRSYGRAFSNRANIGLYNMARSHPDNEVVQLTRPKEGQWTEVGVMLGGERESMFLRSDLVPGWSADPVGVPAWVRAAGGAYFIRPFATGAFAPQFALVNFAFDIAFATTTAGAGRLYSPLYPIAQAQLTRDLAATASDAFGRKGLFDRYIEEGGGMSLLTHQGRILARDITKPSSPTRDAWTAFQQYAGYINESMEIWTRLSIMNKVLRQRRRTQGFLAPTDYEDAAWEARRYLDFGQGGMVIKQIDAVIPYTNAAFQGLRGAGRAIKESPAQMSMRFSQVAGVSAGVWWANHIANPDAWDAVPDYVKSSNLVITTPFFRTDREGNRRYMYFKVPLEHTLRPIKVMSDAVMERVYKGQLPTDTTLKVIREGATVFPGIGGLPPSVSAMFALGGNFDWWRGEQIWRGPTDLPPTFERNITGEDPTSSLAIDIAEGVNPLLETLGAKDLRVSPARLEVASRALIPTSPWTDMVGYSYNLATGNLEEEIRELHSKTVQEGLADTPIIKRFIGETHPFIRDAETLREHQEFASADAFKLSEEIRRQIDQFRVGDGFGRQQTRMIELWIREQEPIHQPRLVRFLEDQIKMEAIFDRFDPDEIPNTPSRTWWTLLSTTRSTARASAFWDEWSDAQINLESPDQETRELAQQKLRMIRRLASAVPGFDPKQSKEFGMELSRLSRESGVPLP